MHYSVLVVCADADVDVVLHPFSVYGNHHWVPLSEAEMEEVNATWAELGPDGDGSYATLDDLLRDYFGAERQPGANSKGEWGRWQNPVGSYDWYEVGGRFSGALPIKAEYASQYAPEDTDLVDAGHVDWEAIRCAAQQEARDRYRCWQALPDAEEVDAEAYAKALLEAKLSFVEEPEATDLRTLDEEAYVAKYGCAAPFFAYVDLDGDWYDSGWGARDPDFDIGFWALVDSLPADVQVAVVDCHI